MKINEKVQMGFPLFLAVAAITALIIGGSSYITSIQQSLWIQSVSDVLEVTEQGSHAFQVYIEKDMETLRNFSNNIAQYDSGDEASIMGKLTMYSAPDPNNNFAVIDLDHGIEYVNDGSDQGNGIEEEEVAGYDDWGDLGVMEPTLSNATGRRVLVYYRRFSFADGTRGLAKKTQLLTQVAREFSLSFYNDTGFSYVVNAEGDILIRSDHKNSNHTFSNLFDVIEMAGNSQEDLDAFIQGMVGEKSGAMKLLLDEEIYVFAFVPIKSTQGWYLVSIIPDSIIMEHTEEILMTSQTFLFIVVIAMFIFVLFLYLNWRYRKNMKVKEVEVQYREQFFNILANNTDDVFLMLSSGNYTVEYVSPNVERVLGVPREAVQEDLRALGTARYSDGRQMGFGDLEAIDMDGAISLEGERVHKKTGEHKWFTETVYRCTVESYDRLIIVISDRTVARQTKNNLEEALNIAKAANASKSAFLSNMSHDIRTPMNAIVGLATLLQRDADNPEKVREHTRKITASSQHLLGLINDVLDMSKIESGKTTLNLMEFDLAEIVEEIFTIMNSQAKAKRQEFEIKLYNIRAEHLLGDKLRINQILINILSNAVKYTPVGGKIVMEIRQLSLPQLSPKFVHLQFVVRDNGIGMSPEYLETIFQPFTREISSTTNTIQGTGLGMAITKNLVDLMGGTISVESKQGEGSAFTVEMEFCTQDQEEDGNFWKDFGISQMLIVDDEVDVCSGIMSVMANTDVDTQFALNGQTAVEMVNVAHKDGDDFDLILLDWKMPGMDGVQTARKIRETVPLNIPIMVLTAYDWSDIEEEGRAAGIDGFLHKPFFLSNFKQTIRALWEKKEPVSPKNEEHSVLEGKRVLAAEDNELNADILVEFLDMMGASCQVARDGKEALELFESSERGAFDLILMDVQMPIMNGYEATRAIRASSHPEAASIPIVAMTANAFADDISDALNAGMDAHIAKPMDFAHLESVLRDVFGKKGLL